MVYFIQLMSIKYNAISFARNTQLFLYVEGGGCMNYTENIKGPPYKIDLATECPEFEQPCFGTQHARNGHLFTRCLTINIT
jgi:hypothetical protein